MNLNYPLTKESVNLDTKIIYIARGFPLSSISSTDKACIEHISRLSQLAPVHITNRICGSCFSSFYTLVHEYGFTYTVDPEQKITEDDRKIVNKSGMSISNCFSEKK
jgi:hypothetical protein